MCSLLGFRRWREYRLWELLGLDQSLWHLYSMHCSALLVLDPGRSCTYKQKIAIRFVLRHSLAQAEERTSNISANYRLKW